MYLIRGHAAWMSSSDRKSCGVLPTCMHKTLSSSAGMGDGFQGGNTYYVVIMNVQIWCEQKNWNWATTLAMWTSAYRVGHCCAVETALTCWRCVLVTGTKTLAADTLKLLKVTCIKEILFDICQNCHHHMKATICWFNNNKKNSALNAICRHPPLPNQTTNQIKGVCLTTYQSLLAHTLLPLPVQLELGLEHSRQKGTPKLYGFKFPTLFSVLINFSLL